ncbi:mannitol-1-phosphate 5-dehydrogenase [candidate division KSB1 bacterium]|nr:mannitol-1-phosphate 5-dehydrogenase [candidate division KSB1 bacterium]
MKKLVQFGAGNIGRSFIGQLFSRAGWEVVFVDVDPVIIRALNEKREFIVEIRDERPEKIRISNVRGIDGNDSDRVAGEIAEADCLGSAVGKNALEKIIPNLAQGLMRRYQKFGNRIIDLIICENILDGAQFIRERLLPLLPNGFPLDQILGLVETSIGKMVPIMSAEDRQRDPLLVYAEAYNTLILDKKGFKGEIPAVAGLAPKENMKAYVERKSFIHNLGHAMTAYLEFVRNKGYTYTWEAMADADIRKTAKLAMWESGRALIEAYPDEFNEQNQEEHIENLLKRFANRHLGDTIFRVGRDIQRKLSYDDRLIGAMRFALAHGVEPVITAMGAAAACFFKKTDEAGALFPGDAEFHATIFPKGVDYILSAVCGLTGKDATETQIISLIKSRFYRFA